ncbi:hypothetical protein HMPREF9374_0800 [Desmospora sp. 8437]|nr:hypothetical protein HMPREF9374_0800 [Desmospora sp. 8437]
MRGVLCQRKENRAGNTCPVFLMKGVNHPNHYFIDVPGSQGDGREGYLV